MRIAMVGNGRSVHVTGRSAAVAARGHRVRLVTLGPVLDAPDVDVRTRPIPRSVPAALTAARGFLRDVREFRPDLLHLHYAGGKLGTMATLTAVRPLVVTVMGGDVLPEQHPGGVSRLERRATRRILRQADLLLVKADALRPALARFGVAPDRVETVRWGIDPAVFRRDPAAAARLRGRLGLGAQDRVLLSPRLLAPLYNVHLLVEALPAVLVRVPAAVLVLTEYGAQREYRESLARRAAELGVAERVRFVGPVAHSEMPALYSLADVVLSVPSSDGLPQSMFEAMACEAPLVVGRLRTYSEVLADGETALAADFDPASIAGAVARLLEDEGLRARIAAEARRRVWAVASLPEQVDRVLALYERLLAQAPPPATNPLRDGRLIDALALLLR